MQRNSLCPWPATSAILPNSTAQLELSEEAPSCNATLAAPALGALQRGVAEAAALSPVSEPQFCTLKDGAAVKCSMAFQSGDLNEAYVAGQPVYVAFESTQLTQVPSCACCAFFGPAAVRLPSPCCCHCCRRCGNGDLYVAANCGWGPLYQPPCCASLQIVFQVEASDLGGLGPAKNCERDRGSGSVMG